MLPLLLLAVPIAELVVLVQVSGQLGLGTTIILLLLVSIVGVWVAKAAGLGVLRRMQSTVRAGRLPSNEVVDGFLVLVAGLLMVVPGFVTDGIAVLLLLPPTRAGVRGLLLRRVRRGATWVVGVRGHAGAHEVAGWETQPGDADTARPRPPGEPGALEP
jgi:UPF0716 protein FxsA